MRATESPQFRSILGINFFVGDAVQAVQRMKNGGLHVRHFSCFRSISHPFSASQSLNLSLAQPIYCTRCHEGATYGEHDSGASVRNEDTSQQHGNWIRAERREQNDAHETS